MKHLRLCPWSLALASSIPVLGLESVCPRKGCPWPRIFFVSLAFGLEPCVLDSTSGNYALGLMIRGGVEDTRLETKAKAKDTKKILGQGQGQPFRGQTLSRPRTGMLEAKDQGHKAKCSPKKKKKKKVFTKIFQAITKIFQALHKILTFQKIVLSSSRGQANFRGLEASRPRPRTSKSVLEDVLEAKDVLEDSTSVNDCKFVITPTVKFGIAKQPKTFYKNTE